MAMSSNHQFHLRLLGSGFAIIATAVVGWGLYQALAQPGSLPFPAPLAQPSELNMLEDRVAGIEKRLESIDLALMRLSSSLSEQDNSASLRRNRAAMEAHAESAGINQVEAAAMRDRILADHEKAFRSQATANRWGKETAIWLMDKVDSDDILSVTSALPMAQDVDCRAEMCRMTFTFPDAGKATEWSDAYLATLGNSVGRAWTSVVDQPDGSTQVIMYGFK